MFVNSKIFHPTSLVRWSLWVVSLTIYVPLSLLGEGSWASDGAWHVIYLMGIWQSWIIYARGNVLGPKYFQCFWSLDYCVLWSSLWSFWRNDFGLLLSTILTISWKKAMWNLSLEVQNGQDRNSSPQQYMFLEQKFQNSCTSDFHQAINSCILHVASQLTSTSGLVCRLV